MPALAFEIEHGIDHMLQHAGPGDGALLGHMADQEQRDAALLRQPDEIVTAGPHLRDRAGGGFDRIGKQRLHRIDDGGIRAFGFQRGEDILQGGGDAELQSPSGHAEALGAQSDLMLRFLAGDIGHLQPLSG